MKTGSVNRTADSSALGGFEQSQVGHVRTHGKGVCDVGEIHPMAHRRENRQQRGEAVKQ